MSILKNLLLSLAICLFTASLCSAESLRFVTSPTASGTWYIGMGAVGKAYTDMFSDADVTLLPGGGTTNVPRLASNAADVGVVTHCIAMAALKGLSPYKAAVPTGISSVFNLWDRANYQIVALADSKLKNLKDLKTMKGAKLGVGPSGSTTEIVFRMILANYGITYDDIRSNGGKILTNNFDDVANMAKDGQIDLFCWFGPGEGWFITEVSSSTDLKWLPIDADVAQKVGETLGLKLGILPKEYYKGRVGENVNVLWDAAELVVRSGLSDETVYRLTKAISEKSADIIMANAAWKGMNPAEAWKDMVYPLHPGAARYYKEKGYIK